MVTSALLFVTWVLLPAKKWPPQVICFLFLLGEMVLDIVLADNQYAAFWTTYSMSLILVSICIPLVHVVDSLRKVGILINAYIIIFLYIGVVAIFNDGMGPARNLGGQDENYTAALMCMAIPVAGFSIYIAKGTLRKLWLVGALAIYLAAIVIGSSRGGLVGLAVAGLYYLVKSPKKWVPMSIGGLAVIAMLWFASAAYWQDMSTITDPTEGTADLRIQAWEIAFRMFLAYPIFGVGPNNFIWHASAFQSAEQYDKFGRGLFLLTHSTYFEMLCELGLVGVGLFCAMLYYNYKDVRFMTKQLQRWKENALIYGRGSLDDQQAFRDDCEKIRCLAYGVMGATVGLLAAFAFLSGTYYSNIWVLTSMIVALKALALQRIEEYQQLPCLYNEHA